MPICNHYRVLRLDPSLEQHLVSCLRRRSTILLVFIWGVLGILFHVVMLLCLTEAGQLLQEELQGLLRIRGRIVAGEDRSAAVRVGEGHPWLAKEQQMTTNLQEDTGEAFSTLKTPRSIHSLPRNSTCTARRAFSDRIPNPEEVHVKSVLVSSGNNVIHTSHFGLSLRYWRGSLQGSLSA